MTDHFIIAITGSSEIQLPENAELEQNGRRLAIYWRGVRRLVALWLGRDTIGGGGPFHVFAIAASDDRARPFFAAQLPAARVASLDEAWAVPKVRAMLEAAGVKDDGSGRPDRKPHTWAGESPFFDRT